MRPKENTGLLKWSNPSWLEKFIAWRSTMPTRPIVPQRRVDAEEASARWKRVKAINKRTGNGFRIWRNRRMVGLPPGCLWVAHTVLIQWTRQVLGLPRPHDARCWQPASVTPQNMPSTEWDTTWREVCVSPVANACRKARNRCHFNR